MTLPKTGLSGPFLNFANGVQRALNALRSVPVAVYGTVSDLPKADEWQGRAVIVRDIDGAGTKGMAFALDGAWHDVTGATIA
jgi:hypothetical protein